MRISTNGGRLGQTRRRNPDGRDQRGTALRPKIWGGGKLGSNNWETIRRGILPAQKRGRYERNEDQQTSGEQAPATSPGHKESPGNECLLGGFWETDPILSGHRKPCCDGFQSEPVD